VEEIAEPVVHANALSAEEHAWELLLRIASTHAEGGKRHRADLDRMAVEAKCLLKSTPASRIQVDAIMASMGLGQPASLTIPGGKLPRLEPREERGAAKTGAPAPQQAGAPAGRPGGGEAGRAAAEAEAAAGAGSTTVADEARAKPGLSGARSVAAAASTVVAAFGDAAMGLPPTLPVDPKPAGSEEPIEWESEEEEEEEGRGCTIA